MYPPLGWEITQEVQELIDKNIISYLPIEPYHNATYSKEEIGHIVLNAVSNKKFITAAIEDFQRDGKKVTSSSNLFRQLRKASPDTVLRAFTKANTCTLAHARSAGAFNKTIIAALDYHDMVWYGKKNRSELVGIANRRGTNLGHRYASIESTEDFRRFTFGMLPVTQTTAKKDVITSLVLQTRLWVQIALLLLDKGFFNVPCINRLNALRVTFVIPAIRNSKIKSMIPMALGLAKQVSESPDSYYVNEYTMKEGHSRKTTTFNLVFYFTPNKNMEEPDDCFIFATNAEITDDNVSWYAGIYRKRWGIETGYRIKEEVRGKTCSTSYSVRLLLQIISILLYNVWALFNYIHRNKAKKLKKGWLYHLTIPKLRTIISDVVNTLLKELCHSSIGPPM